MPWLGNNEAEPSPLEELEESEALNSVTVWAVQEITYVHLMSWNEVGVVEVQLCETNIVQYKFIQPDMASQNSHK